MDALENKLNKDSKRGNGKRKKNTKLMVQQPGEAMEKNKKESPTTGGQRNTQTGNRQTKRKGIWL
jgi:hypothetical protein